MRLILFVFLHAVVILILSITHPQAAENYMVKDMIELFLVIPFSI